MIQLRVRSAAEHAKFEEYQSHWKTKVTEFQKMYPEWSEQDITHLKQQFELFDKDKDCLIEFKEFDATMNELNDQSSYEERFSYFDAANDSRTGYINFEEFLKMMNTLKQNRGSEDKSLPLADRFKSDTSTSEMTGIVRQMDSFQQMCYGVF